MGVAGHLKVNRELPHFIGDVGLMDSDDCAFLFWYIPQCEIGLCTEDRDVVDSGEPETSASPLQCNRLISQNVNMGTSAQSFYYHIRVGLVIVIAEHSEAA